MSEVAELLDRLPGSASFVTQDQASLVLSHYTFDQLIGFRAATLLLALLGFLGNLLVVLVIVFRKRWRFANSMFVLNIAVANLFICTFTLPLMTRALFNISWEPAPQFCQLSGFLDNTAFACSAWSLALGSVERLFLVVFPMRHRQLMNYQRAVMISFLIWALSIILSVLPILGWNTYIYSPVTFSCGISPSLEGVHGYYFLVYLTIVLPGPLLISTFSYTYVLFYLLRVHYTMRPRVQCKTSKSVQTAAGTSTLPTSQRTNQLPNEQTTDIFGTNIQEILKSTKQRNNNFKIVIPMILITIAFMLCFMPNVVIGFDIIFNPSGQPKLKMIEYLTIHFLLLGNSAVNPIIFTMCSPKFRSGGKVVLIVLYERFMLMLVYASYAIYYSVEGFCKTVGDAVIRMVTACCHNVACVKSPRKYDSLNDVVIKVIITNSHEAVELEWGQHSPQHCMMPSPRNDPYIRNNEFEIELTKLAIPENRTSETIL